MNPSSTASEKELRAAAGLARAGRVVEVPLEAPELDLFVTPGGDAFCSSCSARARGQLYRVSYQGARTWLETAPDRPLRCRCGRVELVVGRLEEVSAP